MYSFFLIPLALVLLLVFALHAYRQYWFHRDLPQIYTAAFHGELMKVGATYIARRPAKNNSQRTIICFPGFLEDMRYFQNVYNDEEAELIFVNNANYHCPFPTSHVTELQWPVNPFLVGSIEYDGFYLGLTLERLASGREVCIHGHSRGGAVVLETGRQYPALTTAKDRWVSAILEAPVLPQAKTAGNASAPLQHRINCYFLPIFFGLSRNMSTNRLLKLPMMQPTNTLKTHLCLSIFSTTRSYATCVNNIQSIFSWQQKMGFNLYDNFPALTVVVGERDNSLDRPSMLASAEQGQMRNSGLSILKTIGTNHFISLEQPDTIRTIH